jgi:predicted permease
MTAADPRSEPPRLAQELLRLVLPAGLTGESIKGDLDQEYKELIHAEPARRWRWWYRREVLKLAFGFWRHRVLGDRTRSGGRAHEGARPPGRRERSRVKGVLSDVAHDLRVALRSLRRQPVFATAAIVTVAVGIGATTAMFSVVNSVLLEPLPYDEPESLVSVWHTAPGFGKETLNQTAATYFTYREENRTFEDIGLWDTARLSVTGLDGPEEVRAIGVTDATFPLLRVRPLLGRFFAAADDSPGVPLTVVLSNGFWRGRLGSDPDAVGRTITVSGVQAEIIGVLPPDFRFLNFDAALFFPFRFDRSTIRGVYTFTYQAVSRLRPGVTIEQANADVERMIPMSLEKFPGGRGVSLAEMETIGFGAKVLPLKHDVVGDIGGLLWVLFGTVGVVLLLACANVANLFLVRAEGRQQEVAVRAALGAGRGQLARHLLTESIVLALAGGAAGLALAYAGLRLLVSLGPERLPRLEEITIDPTVLAFAVGISLTAGLLFGLYSMLRLRHLDLVASLKEAGRGAGTGRERQHMRSALVVSQLALALLLLVGSGLMIRSFVGLLAVHPGFERPEELLVLRINVPPGLMRDDVAAARVHEQIIDGIRQIPGVTAAGISSSVTMDGWDDNNAIYFEDFPVADDEVPPVRAVKYVSEGYFETMGNPVLAGRAITRTDIRQRARVVMVTANVAREYWNTPAAALGKRISESRRGPWFGIVGVVGDVHDDGVDREATPIVYWPMVRSDESSDDVSVQRSLGYAVRSTRLGDPSFLVDIRRAVWQVNPDLPVARVRTLEELLHRSMARTSFTLVMLGIAAVVAVLLGMVGVYGVISYSVAQRTREIGVRVAFGATRRDVGGMVLRHGAVLAGVGVVIGLAAAMALTRLMASLLYGVSPLDPVTFAVVAVGLAGVALLASYLPARRAARVDPMEALR